MDLSKLNQILSQQNIKPIRNKFRLSRNMSRYDIVSMEGLKYELYYELQKKMNKPEDANRRFSDILGIYIPDTKEITIDGLKALKKSCVIKRPNC